MAQTTSEREFEKFCRTRGLRVERIPETRSKTPDYELHVGTTRVIIEIKETDLNPEEREAERLLAQRGWGGVVSRVPGGRVRKMIEASSAQLKARSNGVSPAILVVFDRGQVAGHVESYNIRVAMYGLEQVHVTVPAIGVGKPYATGISHGPKRKMTATDNRSISAIAALVMTGPEEHHLLVYRNAFARVPLEPALLGPFGVRHFDIDMTGDGSRSDWKEI